MSFRYKLFLIIFVLTLPLHATDLLLRFYDSAGNTVDSVFVRGEIDRMNILRASVPEEYSTPEYRVGVFFADSPDMELFSLLEPMDVADYADQAGWAHIAATALNVPGGDTVDFAWFADSSRIAENAYIAVWSDSAGWVAFTDSSLRADTSGFSFLAALADSALRAILADSADYAESTLYADTAEYARNAVIPDSVLYADTSDYANAAGYVDSAAWADSALWATRSDSSMFADTAEYARNAVATDSVLYADSAAWADTSGYSLVTAWADSALIALLAEYTVNAESSVYADTAEYARNGDSCSYDNYIIVAPTCGDYDNLADAFSAIPPGDEQWVIKLMPGNYVVTTPVTLPTLVTMTADGPDVVSVFLISDLTMGSYSGIRNIQFNGGEIHMQGGNLLQNCIMDTTELHIDGSQNNALDRIIFRGDAGYTAITLGASTGASLFGCAFTDCQTGISAATGGSLFRMVNCMFNAIPNAFDLTGAGATGILENCISSGSGYGLGITSLLQIDSPSNAGFAITAAPNVMFLDQAMFTSYNPIGGDWSWTSSPDQVDEALDELADQVPAPGRTVQAAQFQASERINLPIYSGASVTPTGLSFSPIDGDMIIWNDTSGGADYKICVYVGGAWECTDVN